MSKAKKVILCIVLVVIIAAAAVVVPMLLKKPKDDGNNTPNTPFVYEKSPDGKYIYFGEYPQSLKEDSVTVSATPDANGYYLGSDGERYVKQTMTWSEETSGLSNEEATALAFNKASNGTVMEIGSDYYFKVEKIKWRILHSESGESLIVCDSILQGMAYQPNYTQVGSYYYATDSQGEIIKDGDVDVYANNYKHSALRSFLTTTFYNSAFTTAQKDLITLTQVDNSASTTNNSTNIYACEDTNDYVFALSYADVINESYGFSATAREQDINRKWDTTDFAKATGAVTITREFVWDVCNIESEEDIASSEDYALYAPYIGSDFVWLRSPNSISSYSASGVSVGFSDAIDLVDCTFYGVVPALQISLGD